MEIDRELLELAAMAVGAKPSQEDGVIYAGFGSREWNPLTDDGDALRLAVKLGIGMRHHVNWSQVFSINTGIYDFKHNGDQYAATRRAIVLAAAEIGCEKQNEASNEN